MSYTYGFNSDNLKKLVEDSSLPCVRLEILIGLPKGVLAKYLNDSLEPSIRCALKLADYYKVSVDYIIGREGFAMDTMFTQEEMMIGEKLALLGVIESLKYRRDRMITELGKMLEYISKLSEMLEE